MQSEGNEKVKHLVGLLNFVIPRAINPFTTDPFKALHFAILV